MISSLVVGVLAGLMACAIGLYGWRNAPDLAQRTQHKDSYEHRVSVLRRGAVACWVAGVALGIGSIAAVL